MQAADLVASAARMTSNSVRENAPDGSTTFGSAQGPAQRCADHADISTMLQLLLLHNWHPRRTELMRS
jgi:hypothetical protein